MSEISFGPFQLWAGAVSHRGERFPVGQCSARITEGTHQSKYRRYGRSTRFRSWSTQVVVVTVADGRVFTYEFEGSKRADAIRFVESVAAQSRLARERPAHVPAGWYPESGRLRWWDGRQWTDHYASQPTSNN